MSDANVRLLIDGYNLLHASGVFPPGVDPTFERSRQTLLEWLEKLVDPRLKPRTIIVFDGMDAAPRQERRFEHAEMIVIFSRRKQSADEVLEELIASAAFPKQLTVVSSDHRVQRAARQRSIAFVDSESWVARLGASITTDTDDKPSSVPNPFPPEYLEGIDLDET